MPPLLHTLKIWGAGVYSPRSYGAEFVCLFFVCPSRYDARHRKPRRFVYALNLGGTGISPADKSPPGQKTRRTKAPPDKNPPGPTSGDIFYCSGSRQLNHSSFLLLLFDLFENRLYRIIVVIATSTYIQLVAFYLPSMCVGL